VPDAAIFIGWGTPYPGREGKALALFGEAMTYYTALQQKGTIESVEPVLLTPHGGDLGGFILLRGQPDKLAALKLTEEFQRLTVRAQLLLSGVGVIDANIGGSLATAMGSCGEQIQALA